MAKITYTRVFEREVPDEELLRICRELLEEWEGETDEIGINDIVNRCFHEGLLKGAKPTETFRRYVEVTADDWAQDFYTYEQFRKELEE